MQNSNSPIKNVGGISLRPTTVEGIATVQVEDGSCKGELAWDRYMRLSETAVEMQICIDAIGPDAKVLDVGGFDGALAFFLPQCSMHLIDPLTTGGTGTKIPVPDESYDVVASIDAIEHVHPQHRRAFVAELCRVSKHFVIINYPSSASMPAQQVVYKLTGNRYIGEHVEYLLPETANVLSWLAEEGCSTKVRSHTSTAVWVAHFTLSSLQPDAGKIIGRHLKENYLSGPTREQDCLYDLLLASK